MRRWWAPALQALALALVLVLASIQIDAARADAAADEGFGPGVAVPARVQKAAPPVTLGIPKIKLTNRLIGLRKQRNGTLAVPVDPQRAGWYSQGAAPGDPGPAVIIGHVDSYRGPGVFAKLDTLHKGDLIRIRRADGTLVTFAVRVVRDYPKRAFPTALVYRGDGKPSLRLITCGGEFDRRSKHYRDNTIVFADLVTRAPAKARPKAPHPEQVAPKVAPKKVAPKKVTPAKVAPRKAAPKRPPLVPLLRFG